MPTQCHPGRSWLLAAAIAAASPAIASPATYEQTVPEELRELVGPARFAAAADVLERLRKSGIELDAGLAARIQASPCSGSITDLIAAYTSDPEVRAVLGRVGAGLTDLPPGYLDKPMPEIFRDSSPLPCPAGSSATDCGMRNPWKNADGSAPDSAELLGRIAGYLTDWCSFLPRIDGARDNGLLYIQGFAWLYYRNPAGQGFVQEDPGRAVTTAFSNQRGRFMSSSASRSRIEEWIDDPRIEIADYRLQRAEDYPSWNAFFARELAVDPDSRTIPSRPATMPQSEYPERDYIVVSPTDCIMNPLVQVLAADGKVERRYVENPLQEDTVLDVKGIPISVRALLADTPEEIRNEFVGGTGLTCVLMPSTYHHFHAPVSGTVVHAEVVRDGTYGYPDFPNWVPLDGNVGRPGTDFSQFQRFQRGVVVIEVVYGADPGDPEVAPLRGYVASIPVGLNTVGSVVLDKDIVPGAVVKRGYTRLGNFYYGGSLDILLFSAGLAPGVVQTRLGSQINLFDIGSMPNER